MEQLFNIPSAEDINYIQTVRAIKKFFKDYLMLRVMAGSHKLPNITSTYKTHLPILVMNFIQK